MCISVFGLHGLAYDYASTRKIWDAAPFLFTYKETHKTVNKQYVTVAVLSVWQTHIASTEQSKDGAG